MGGWEAGKEALPARKMASLLSLQGHLVTYEALSRFGDLCELNPTGVGSGPRVGLGAWKWKREANRGAPFAQARVVPSSGSKEKDLKDFNLGGGEKRIRTRIHICSDNMSKLSAHRGGECGQQLVASSMLPFW